MDHPEAFGQHSNADIASQIKETRLGLDLFHTAHNGTIVVRIQYDICLFSSTQSILLGTLLSLQPQRSVAQGESKEDKASNWRL